MEKERREDEWKKLKDDTDKLVLAANDLKEMIEKSNKDTFSLSIVKKTEEVEKDPQRHQTQSERWLLAVRAKDAARQQFFIFHPSLIRSHQ